MGKISEALKKAGKADPIRPAVRKEKLYVPEPAPTASQAESKPLARAIQVHVADSGDLKPAKDILSGKEPDPVKEPIGHAEPADTPPKTAAQSSGQLALREPDGTATANRGRAIPIYENAHVAMQSPAPVPAEPRFSSDKVSRLESGDALSPDRVQKHARRPIRVSYSETRVQSMDPAKLKNNRIFSFFDEIETTNQIKILRTQVLKRLDAIGGNSILITSANPHEGKTFTSINLGVSIAKEFSRTVLIIDADLRKPTKRHADFSTDFFSIDVEFGLTEYLKGEAEMRDILINPGIERMVLIPAGKPVDNAPELLNSKRMAEMMNDVKRRYGSERLVIVDGPALLPFPDALLLSQYVDGVLPVVELERTPVDQLKRMIDNLKGTLILGTVLNKNKV